MIVRYLFYAFLIYLAYRFIVGFVIPVYKTTKQVKRQFRDIQEKMQEQQYGGNTSPGAQTASANNASGNPKVGDYIDFEEVREK